MAMRRVTNCKREATMTGGCRYVLTLACGHTTTRQCKWNRVRYVPGPPTKAKCVECEKADETKGD